MRENEKNLSYFFIIFFIISPSFLSPQHYTLVLRGEKDKLISFPL